MPKTSARSYSRYSQEATRLLGMMIRVARIKRQMTLEELAERAGVSRGLVSRAEAGDLGCAIGTVFELAAIVGVTLFSADQRGLAQHIADEQRTLALLPRAVHHSDKAVNDDF